MTDDDRIPASFVWTGDDGPDDQQKVPEGPAMGNYPTTDEMFERYRDIARGGPYTATNPDHRATVGEKLARFLNDLAEKVRGVH